MRCLVVQHEKERLIWFTHLFEPFKCFLGDDVSRVPSLVSGLLSLAHDAGRMLIAHFDELRIHVLTLTGQDGPVIKTDGIGVQVILSYETRLIAVGLQVLRERRLALVEPREFVDAVSMCVLARHDHSATGRADGVGDKSVGETHATGG